MYTGQPVFLPLRKISVPASQQLPDHGHILCVRVYPMLLSDRPCCAAQMDSWPQMQQWAIAVAAQ